MENGLMPRALGFFCTYRKCFQKMTYKHIYIFFQILHNGKQEYLPSGWK